MKTTSKQSKAGRQLFAFLSAGVTLAIATFVSASTSQQLQPLASLAVPRTGHTATALSDGRIIITGGRDDAGTLVADSEIFDPESQTSTGSATLTTARVDHTATVLLDGRVLVAGGSDADGNALSSAEIFDPADPDAGFQVIASPMTAARAHHTATLLNNGSVLIAGGEATGTAEIFDPNTQSFTPTLWNLTVARSGHTATLFTDDSVLLAGGNTASMEMFTPLDQHFTLDQATLSFVRTGHWVFELSDTRLLLFQGDTGNSIDEFNPSTDTITPKGSLDFHASSSTLLANGKLLVLGTDVSGLYNPDAVLPAPDFTPFDNASVPNSVILPRSGQTSVQLPGDKRILISGGVDGFNQLMGQMLYNPAKIWTDKDDYQPDEPVILSASGWKANEPVYLFAVDNETEQWTYEMTVNADSNGEFVLSPYFIIELRHLGVQFHVTAVGQSTLQADVYFTDTSSQVTKVAYDRGPAVNFVSGAVDGPIGLQTQNSSSLPESLTGNATNSNVTITITSSSVTGRFDTTPGGTFTATSLPQSINATTPSNPNFPDFYYEDTAAPGTTVIITATVTAKGSGLTSLPLNSTANLTKVLKRQPTFSNLNPSPSQTITQGTASISVSGRLNAGGGNVPSGTGTVKIGPLSPVTIGPFGAGNGAFGPTSVNTSTLAPGTYTITYSYPGDANYASATDASTQLIVTAPTPTPTPTPAPTATPTPTPAPTATPTPTPATVLTVAAAASTYGGSVNLSATLTSNSSPVSGKSISFTLNGNAAGSGVTDGSGVATVTVNPLCGSSYNAGLYSSGVAASFAGDGSYTGSSGSNSLTVGKATATFTVTPYSVTYDGNPHTATVSTITGVCGETGATVGTVTLSTTHTNAGTYNTDSWSFTGTANYNDIATTMITDTINQANATVTADDLSKTYGQANPGLTATVVGQVVGGDAINYTLATTATQFSNVGPYPITVTLGSNPNYNVTSNNGTLTINQAVATVTADDLSKTYGQANPTLTATVVGEVAGGDSINYTLATSATQFSNVGPYPITVTLGANPNYNVTATDGTLTINQANASVTADPKSKTYGDANPALTATVVGQVVGGDSINYTLSTTATQFSGVGNYAIVVNLGSNPNYNVTTANGTLTIDPKNASVTANNANKTYGDANPAFTATVVGQVVGGDAINYTLSTTAVQCSNVGPYAITVNLGSNPNYNVTPTNGTLTINKKNLTVKADNKNKAYDGNPYSPFTVTITGFTCGDTVAVVTGSAGFTGTAVGATIPGTYTITPTQGSLSATNYDFTPFVNGTLTIGYGTCTGSTPGGVILPPINSDGTSVYKRKAGSTIPVKFTVCGANGQPISNPYAVFLNYPTGGELTMLSERRGTIDNVNEAGTNDVPDVAFTFSGDHWQFNMATTNLNAPSTYTYKINLADGSGITFVVGTK
jgi:ribosomal protein L18E